MVANQGKITTLAVDASVNKGLVDGTDKMHSGLLKVLESFAQGNICISHAGFTITDGGTYTQYNLAQPIKFLSNGEFTNHTVTLTEAYTATVQDATNSRYDWVLINPATPELVIVQGTAGATPLVSDITAGYIPIALVHITAGTDDDKFDYAFQTFTMNVTKNSLSVGYNSSGYVESGKITGDANSIDITSTITNADINLTPNGTGDVKLGTLPIDGDQTLTDGHVLTYSSSNGNAALAALPTSISNVVEDTTPQLGGNLDTNSNHIDFDDAHGIRDSNGNEQLIFQETTSAVNYLEITNAATSGRVRIETNGDDTDVGLEIDTKGGGTILLDSVVYVNRIQTGYGSGPGQIQVYNAGDNLQLYAAGDSNGNQMVLELDAGIDGAEANRIASVTGHLEVSQEIRSKGYIRNITEVVGSALGPPPVVNYSVLETDDIIIAKAPSGSPPNDLTLNLPDAEAADIGRTYRIIASDATATLSLDKTGTDDTIEDTTGGTLTLPYSLSAGKIYDITCIDADRWMLMQLN
jgi:hypothetical protein